MMAAEPNLAGQGQRFRCFTAYTEITGGVLLLWTGRTVFGALLLTGVCSGAYLRQLLAIHQGAIHTIVIGGTYRRNSLG